MYLKKNLHWHIDNDQMSLQQKDLTEEFLSF